MVLGDFMSVRGLLGFFSVCLSCASSLFVFPFWFFLFLFSCYCFWFVLGVWVIILWGGCSSDFFWMGGFRLLHVFYGALGFFFFFFFFLCLSCLCSSLVFLSVLFLVSVFFVFYSYCWFCFALGGFSSVFFLVEGFWWFLGFRGLGPFFFSSCSSCVILLSFYLVNLSFFACQSVFPFLFLVVSGV